MEVSELSQTSDHNDEISRFLDTGILYIGYTVENYGSGPILVASMFALSPIFIINKYIALEKTCFLVIRENRGLYNDETYQNSKYYVICEGHLVRYTNLTSYASVLYLGTLKNFAINSSIILGNPKHNITILPDHDYIVKLPTEAKKLCTVKGWKPSDLWYEYY